MPGLGLIFWMTISFGVVLVILKKYAWKPILSMLNQREKHLAKSFSDAKRIQHELSQLSVLKTTKVAEAEKERDEIIARAKNEADLIIEKARDKAELEARVIAEQADELIEKYKREAMREIKGQLSALSLDIAEKVLTEELSDRQRNELYVDRMLSRVAAN